jgi:hypothetical protein
MAAPCGRGLEVLQQQLLVTVTKHPVLVGPVELWLSVPGGV